MTHIKILEFLVIIICSAFALQIRAQDTLLLKEKLDALVYEDLNIDFERTPGFIVGIITPNGKYHFSYGTTNKDSVTLPSRKTVFEIGSLTNVFTARLVNILEENKVLNKEQPLNELLPDRFSNASANKITLQHLLTHTAGLPRVPIGIGKTQQVDNQPFQTYTKEMLGEYYKNYPFQEEEMGSYLFSHLGYALIELIIEHKTGKKFEQVLQAELLKNDLLNTKIDRDVKEITQGFDKAHNATSPWQYAGFAAATGISADIDDLLRLLEMNIFTDEYDQMQQPLYPTEMRKGVSIGEAWHVIEEKKHYPIVLHTGATSGHRGYMAFVKETQTGVVVLSNSEYALRGLGYLILKDLNRGFKKRK